jgi:hypothetical protein
MDALPPELIILIPLAVAAGIDLYLTLLFLGAVAPMTSWRIGPLPGALGDLDSGQVLIVVGMFYVLEFAAERYAPSALVWNAFHAIIRPVAGALLALLLLDGEPMLLALAGAIVAGTLSSFAHAVRSGGAIVRWLGSATAPHVLIVSTLEDSIVVGLIALSLDFPLVALVCAVALVGGAALVGPSHARAFTFAVRLAVARVAQTITQRRWLGPEELPPWVRHSMEGDVLAPGGALRGSPAGAHRLPAAPRFATGWVVVRGGSPLFVYRRGNAAAWVDLGPLTAERVVETGFFRRVDLKTSSGAPVCVFFGVNGPSEASLRAEFMFA